MGIFDVDGEGEVVGGIVVMRYGENADAVIKNVKIKMKEVEKGFHQTSNLRFPMTVVS
ncbi:MAG: hypothetical protein R2822_30300 [Spirosomataceae bacterium]